MSMTKTEQLARAFDFKDVEWRVGTSFERDGKLVGTALTYVTNRAIQDRLDEVFGIEGWYNEFKKWGENAQLCGISVKFGDQWITKWDGSENSAVECTKGGLSNSQKRAAVQFSIGRYIYKMETVFVELEVKGKSKVIKKQEYAKLENFYNQQVSKIFGTNSLPAVNYEKPKNENLKPNINYNVNQKSNNVQNKNNSQFENNKNTNSNVNTNSNYNDGNVNVVKNSLIRTVKQIIKLKSTNIDSVIKYYGINSLDELTVESAKDCLRLLGEKSA